MEIEDEEVILQPHPDRCAKLLLVIDEALATNRLSSDSACKLVFLTTTMFGQLGKAALTPVYARAHGLSDNDKADQLNGPLKSALSTLKTLLEDIQPRGIPKVVGACSGTEACGFSTTVEGLANPRQPWAARHHLKVRLGGNESETLVVTSPELEDVAIGLGLVFVRSLNRSASLEALGCSVGLLKILDPFEFWN